MALVGRAILQRLVAEQRALQAVLSGHLGQQPASWAVAQSRQQPFGSSSNSSCSSSSSNPSSPVVKSPPPAWEAEYKAWTHLRQTNEQLIKQYPALDKKQKMRDDSQRELKLAPVVTKADESGAVSTMKRRLTVKLVLLVKARDPAAAAAAAAPVWTFPTTAHQAGESIREAAERALKEAIGPSQVYFVGNSPMAHRDLYSSSSSSSSADSTGSPPAQPADAGSSSSSSADTTGAPSPPPAASSSSSSSADSTGSPPAQPADAGSSSSSSADTTGAPSPPPAASSSSSSTSSGSSGRVRPPARVFFHLAQVVNDPWEVSLQGSAAASEFAWVGKEELGQYLQDEALLALAHKML